MLKHHEMKAAHDPFVVREAFASGELQNKGHCGSIAKHCHPGFILGIERFFPFRRRDCVLSGDVIALNAV